MTSILTMLGVAIGLGNVWRFPYMMGRYGGSAFLAVYIAFTILFAFPALMAEMTLGRLSGKGTLDSMRIAFGKRAGNVFGYLLLIVITIAGSYYAVVVGNVFYTSAFSIARGFSPDTVGEYHAMLANGWLQYGITVLLIGASIFVIHKGLLDGIERISKIVMPLFFLALVYMIVHALSMPHALEKCREFLRPDFSALKSTQVFAALGQAFFSVGLGGTFVVVYASFLKKDEDIPTISLYTGLGDAGASLLISLFLVPSVLVMGMNMASGPGLIFNTFPLLFSAMPGGRFIGSLFLISIFIVAFLSLVAAYQVPFTCIRNEQAKMDGKRILLIIGVGQAILSMPSTVFPDLIGVLDLVFGSGMQVLGSALCILGLTWGVRRNEVLKQMFLSDDQTFIRKAAFFWIKWIIPMALLAVLALYVYDVLI